MATTSCVLGISSLWFHNQKLLSSNSAFSKANSSYHPERCLPAKLTSSRRVATTALFSNKGQASDPKPTKVQKFHMYEFNEDDRESPAILKLSDKQVNAIGDLALYTNTIYSGDLQKRLGTTAGMCVLIEHKPEKNGDRYENISSYYLEGYGHISVQGPYFTYYPLEEAYLAVTGGTGIFEGVSGQVKMQPLLSHYKLKVFYTFYLKGIPDIPAELMEKPVPPSANMDPLPAAKADAPNGC